MVRGSVLSPGTKTRGDSILLDEKLEEKTLDDVGCESMIPTTVEQHSRKFSGTRGSLQILLEQ